MEQNVPPVPEAPQGAAEVGHRELLCRPGGGIREEQDRPDARQSGTPSGERHLKGRKHTHSATDAFDDSTFN